MDIWEFFPLPVAAAGLLLTDLRCVGREEGISGELDLLEQLAGIAGGGSFRFLGGNAEVVGRHEHLHPALHLDNDEDTDGDQNLPL